jgi:hypothetical protein
VAPRFKPTQEAIAKAKRMNLDLSRGTHGTVMNKDGSTMPEVVPSNKSGRMVHSSMSDPSRAYYTAADREMSDQWTLSQPYSQGAGADKDGWTWARLAADSKGAGTRMRAVVHNVAPSGTVDQDVNLPSSGAMTANKLKVTDTQWIPPVTAGQHHSGVPGVQGTLPHVNWNEFRPEGNFGEANWHAYGQDPSISPTERIRRRAEEANAPINPAPSRRPEVAGQLEMFDRPPTWYDEGRKSDL